MLVEVLKCRNCGRLALSIDDQRIATYDTKSDHSLRGHGSGKCAGHWIIVLTSKDPRLIEPEGHTNG